MAEPRSSPSRGEFVTLKEHFECRLEAIEKSISVANDSMQVRLAGMNEFREALKDQASRLVTRDDLTNKFDGLSNRIMDLEKSRANLEGKASQSQVNLTLILSVSGLLLGIVSIAIKIL
jgi:predicted nuclease with TOPRIM domain